jgi:hypothetical protein
MIFIPSMKSRNPLISAFIMTTARALRVGIYRKMSDGPAMAAIVTAMTAPEKLIKGTDLLIHTGRTSNG